jgi:hypothetical protein
MIMNGESMDVLFDKGNWWSQDLGWHCFGNGQPQGIGLVYNHFTFVASSPFL